jgi:hypothetical protein
MGHRLVVFALDDVAFADFDKVCSNTRWAVVAEIFQSSALLQLVTLKIVSLTFGPFSALHTGPAGCIGVGFTVLGADWGRGGFAYFSYMPALLF